MKNMIKTILIIALTVLALTLPAVCRAQTNLTTLDKIIADTGGITNVAFEPYATYAPKAQNKWGGGLFLIYDVNPQDLIQVGVGLGLDWLGGWSLVNGNVTLQTPFHPWSSKFPSWTLSPVVLGGVGTAYSGGGNFNGAPSVVTDAGLFTKFGRLGGGQFNAGFVWGKWQGSGPNDVARYHIVAGWSHGF